MGFSIPTFATGVALGALENKAIAPDMDPGLQYVNALLGGLTALGIKNPETRNAVMSGLPFKQLALFGVNAADKLRMQQQSLVDANLGIANINKTTAGLQQSNAAGAKSMQLAFLLPALAAGAGLGYLGYDKWKHLNKPIPRYATTGEKGRDSSSRSKIRIDIPSSAVPDDFYRSLSNPDEGSKAHIRLLSLMNPGQRKQLLRKAYEDMPEEEQGKVAAFLKKAYADEERVSIPRVAWDIGTELTGLPSLWRSAQDTGHAVGGAMTDDWGQAARYGAAGLGGAMIGLGALGGHLPFTRIPLGLASLAARAIGPRRLAAHVGGATATAAGVNAVGSASRFPRLFRSLLSFPRTAQWLSKHTPAGEAAGEAARAHRFAYNPEAYAWSGAPKMPPGFIGPRTDVGVGGRSSVINALYNRFLTAPSTGPTTLPGHMLQLGRYGANRMLQGGHWANQLIRRNPNSSMMLAGAPMALMGVDRDNRMADEARTAMKSYLPNWQRRQGYFGMPVSDVMAKSFQALGLPDAGSGLRDQIRLPQGNTDPFAPFR